MYFSDPAQSRVLPPCLFHCVTGLYCPGCGSTRALHSLLQGDVCGALAKNSLLVISLPFLAVLYTRPAWTRGRRIPWIVLGIVVAYGILRNLGIFPFVLLAPH